MTEDQGRNNRQLVMLEQMLVTRRTDHELSPNVVAHLKRSAILWNELFRSFTPMPVKITLSCVRNLESVDALPPDDGEFLFIMMELKDLDTKMLSYVDRKSIATLLDLLLGNSEISNTQNSDKPITNVEKKIVNFIAQELINILTYDGGDLSHLDINIKSLITKLPILITEGELGRCFEIDFSIRLDEDEVLIHLLIPEQVFNTENLLVDQQLIDERESQKHIWSQRLKAEISRATVKLDAVLDERSIAFAELLRLRVGEILPLNATTQDRIRVVSNGKPVMHGSLGKANGVYTLRVEGIDGDSN